MAKLPKLTSILTDVTIREGSQQELDLRSASPAAKLELLNAIVATGINQVELTAFAPGEWFSDAESLARSAASLSSKTSFRALYFNARGLNDLLAHSLFIREGIFHTAATNNYRLKNYRQSDQGEVLQKLDGMLQEFKKQKISFDTLVISTAWGEESEAITAEDVLQFVTSVINHAKDQSFNLKRITLADTVGNATPKEIEKLFSMFKVSYPNIITRAHLHPPFSKALESIEAALNGGAEEWEAAWGGVGGSPFAKEAGGNLDIRFLMRVWEGRGAEHGIDIAAVERLISLIKKNVKREVFSV